MDRETFRRALDECFLKTYCVDIRDLGFGDDDIERFHSRNEPVADIVRRIGEKLDLTPRSRVEWAWWREGGAGEAEPG